MPHFIIDCSESILHLADADELMLSVYAAAESTGLFAKHGVGGIKVRLNPYGHFINVDGHEHFVHVFANIMEGRTQEQKKDALRLCGACAQGVAAKGRDHLDERLGV